MTLPSFEGGIKNTFFQLSSYQLKYIALITMIIDHTGVIFRSDLPVRVYQILRCVGRLSFPIFCFLLVEGFFHTRSREKYVVRLLIFSLISELAFDFCLMGSYRNMSAGFQPSKVMLWNCQNVFFTLAIGFIAMYFLEQYQGNQSMTIAIIILGPVAADYLKTDYGAVGVITIILFYLSRKYRRLPLIACYIPLMVYGYSTHIELFCIFSILFLYCYNGEKGHGWRYLFYVIYPVHMFILWLIRIRLFI